MYKKLIFTVLLVLAASTALCRAQDSGKKVPRTEINALVNDFRHYDEFESISLGRFMTSIIRKAGAISIYSDDMDKQERKEARLAFDAMKSIKGMTIVDYEDCSPRIKEKFNNKMAALLDGVELLMSAKDDEDSVYIYGYVTGGGSKVKDLVIYSPNDGGLICLYGTIDMDKIGQIVTAAE